MNKICKAGIASMVTVVLLAGCTAPAEVRSQPATKSEIHLTVSERQALEKLPGVDRIPKPSLIWINSKNPYSTVYYSVESTAKPETIKKVRDLANAEPSVRSVTWDAFLQSGAGIVQPKIARDDYPKINQTRAVASLLRRFPRTPWTVTWNGGIAVTGSDYRYAERSYKRYQADNRVVVRESDQSKDPVHPMNHVGPLFSAAANKARQ